MTKYVTGQRKLLLDFLREHSDRQFSIDDIALELCADNLISKSAVYRNIDKLVKEGAVQKSAADGSRKFLYRYLECGECSEHLHMKCLSCGKMFHLDGETSDLIIKLANSRGIMKVDRRKTLFYGVCKNCT